MMSKIRKMQDSWVAKSIFILTALSFMSLFGISGYIYNAGQNRTVIKVDDIEISQGEVSFMYEKELANARKMFGDNLEINDSIKSTLLLGIVQREVADAILQTTAQKNNIVIGDELIRKIIYSQNEFMNAQGQFDRNRFNLMLSATGWTEQEYIQALRSDVLRQMLVQNPVRRIEVPDFLTDWLGKIENQKRIFSYVKIVPQKLTITRNISDDEVEQYYSDFAENFMAPEKRDVSYFTLSSEDIAEAYNPSQEEINSYYQQNISLFETPEKRDVLQMVFDSEETAQKASNELASGTDFFAVAKSLAQQTSQDTKLGAVSKDMLLADVADDVFSAPLNKVIGPIKSEFGWHIFKVTAVTPAEKMNRKEADKKAAEAIRKEKAYDTAYEFANSIEDKIGAGQSFDQIAKNLGVKITSVKGLAEDGSYNGSSSKLSTDLVDTAFSYNVGEISQVIETDTGYAVLTVNNIVESHLLPLEEIRPQLVKIWENNERDALAQEMINDIISNLENGEKISDVAARLGLKLYVSKPIKKSESFEMMPSSQIAELFQEEPGTPHLFDNGEAKIIAVTSEVVKDTHKLTQQEKADIRNKVRNELVAEAAETLTQSYAQGYDVRVKYKLLGLAD